MTSRRPLHRVSLADLLLAGLLLAGLILVPALVEQTQADGVGDDDAQARAGIERESDIPLPIA